MILAEVWEAATAVVEIPKQKTWVASTVTLPNVACVKVCILVVLVNVCEGARTNRCHVVTSFAGDCDSVSDVLYSCISFSVM